MKRKNSKAKMKNITIIKTTHRYLRKHLTWRNQYILRMMIKINSLMILLRNEMVMSKSIKTNTHLEDMKRDKDLLYYKDKIFRINPHRVIGSILH